MKKIIMLVFCFLIFSSVADAASVPSTRIELHHIFPQTMSGYFNAAGINPDLWCIPLKRSEHIGASGQGIHTMKFVCSAGRNYLDSWRWFAILNPAPSKTECFAFVSVLLAEYGIREVADFYNYKTKQKTGESLKIGGAFVDKFIAKTKVVGPVVTKGLLLAYIAYEAFNFACAADDIFPDEEFLSKSQDMFLLSSGNYEKDFEMSCRQLGEAYMYLGMSIFTKYADKKVDFYKEILGLFSKAEHKQLNVASRCFKNAIDIDCENPFSQILYAETLYWIGANDISIIHAKKALKHFELFDDEEMIDISRRLMIRIEERMSKR